MDILLSVIVTWLSINFGLAANHDHPRVERVPATMISDLRYGSVSQQSRAEVVAVYDDRTRVIYLPDGWSGTTPAEISILVHEMVHHLQNVSGMTHACPAAREQLAYEAQERWLALFGLSLSGEFELDPMTLKVATGCF
jgi:hypothetical protein